MIKALLKWKYNPGKC